MHSSKKIRHVLVALIGLAVTLFLLDFILYPCTFMRNDIHAMTTQDHDLLVVGTSVGKMGIDPDVVLEGSGMSGHNMAVGGEYAVDVYHLVQLAASTHKPKTVIYEVDLSYLVTEKPKGNNYLLFYHEFPLSFSKLDYAKDIMPSSDFRALFFPFYEYSLQTELGRVQQTVSQKITRSYDTDAFQSERMTYLENGHIQRQNVAVEDFPVYAPRMFSEETIQQTGNMEYVDKLITLCEQEDIHLVCVIMPQPQASLNVDPDSYDAAWEYFAGYFGDRNVPLYNFNREYYDSYSHDLEHYVDYDGHLNGDSAHEFSAVLREVIKDEL